MTLSVALIFPVIAALFGIFALWVLWKIVQSLKSIATSLKEIASGTR